MLKLITVTFLALPFAFGQVSLTTAQIAKRVSPSVVVIQGKTDSGEMLGSGFLISKDGKTVTNLHVISDLRTATVQLASGEIFESISVLATDERRDLAIIRIAGFDLPPLDLGNSNSLSAGEPVVIIGSPRGLQGTITAGILSSIRDSGDGFKVLQTDAAVNPGNSGGPLVNGKGQAIGVVSFKLRSSEGLNFAVPINYVTGLLDELHEPMSLEKLRTTQSAKLPQQQVSGSSLPETLSSLSTQIALAGYHYAGKIGSYTDDITSTVVPTNVTSCAVVFTETRTMAPRNSPEPSVIFKDRATVPLGSVAKVDVFQFKNKDIIDGQEQEWAVGLTARSSVVLHETFDTYTFVNKTESTDNAFILFSDEAAAKAIQQSFLHAVDLCHREEPSLKDTLDFLKQKIPLSAVSHVESSANGQGGLLILVSERAAVVSLDSCTGIIGRVRSATIEGRPDFGVQGTTTRYTVPFGTLAEGSIKSFKVASENNFVSGDKSSHAVVLQSKSKEISVATFASTSSTPQNAVSGESTNSFYLLFNDESLAKRVLQAFLHMGELCRSKEPF